MGSLEPKTMTTMQTKTTKTIRCRKCSKRFTPQEWLNNTTCDQPNECGCPQVQKSMAEATIVIDKARKAAGIKVIQGEHTIPTNRDEERAQLYVNVSPILSIELIKKHGR